ncbi:phage portal protein family protein [Capnocytophaga canimorsus]|uniref:phage portal protein family protein n=1 Tax=Capnocytophaga canimorsus TaxID=28188 RepID=UPI0037CE28E0
MSRKNIHKSVQISGNTLKNKVHLNKSNTQNIEQVTRLMVDIIKRQRRLWRTEINHWQAARYARYHTLYPRTYQLEDVYKDIMLDGHLTGITENRTLRTTNKDYVFTINGLKKEPLTDLIKDKQWFENLIEWAHKSIYHGHSLIWIKEFSKGEIKEVELVERGLVIPEYHLLLKDWDATEGIDIRDVSDVLLYAQFYDNVGLLEKAAVYCILKRHSWGSWDEFEELFGVPIRIAKIASQSDAVKQEVAEWLEEMGSAAYGVFPIGTEVDIKENSKSDAFQVFYRKIEALDKELSKLVLHQTMTTENGSSKAQGTVHENTLQEVIYADEKKMLSFLNNKLVPAMRNLGYNIPQNAKIEVEKTADPEKQIQIDGILLGRGYILKKEYIEQTYGVEIEQMPAVQETSTSETVKPNTESEDAKKP